LQNAKEWRREDFKPAISRSIKGLTQSIEQNLRWARAAEDILWLIKRNKLKKICSVRDADGREDSSDRTYGVTSRMTRGTGKMQGFALHGKQLSGLSDEF